MSESRPLTQYQKLIERTRPPTSLKKTAEGELDRLLQTLEERGRNRPEVPAADKSDPLPILRKKMVNEFVPIFVELVEKYSKLGIAMHMDASSLLEGGREIHFEFGLGEYRTQLQGTVTTDAIAFHEVRIAPDVQGQLVAGPMLRLKQLDAESFREFVCNRLTALVRQAARRR